MTILEVLMVPTKNPLKIHRQIHQNVQNPRSFPAVS